MQSELLTYKKFDDPALAQNLADMLDEHGIEYLVEQSPVALSPVFGPGSATSREYLVKINKGDFLKANQILADYESKFTDEVEADYYLLQFSDQELMDVVAKADEWSAFDVVLAKKLLAEKGLKIDEKAEQELKEKRLAELKKPERGDSIWTNIGFAFALVGGILGFFIGWQLWKSMKTLPNGEQVYTYTENDRRKGQQIFYLSFIGLLIAAAYKIYITDFA